MAAKSNPKKANGKPADKAIRKPYTDKVAYIIMRGNGKGSWATCQGTEALYATAMHGYVSAIYKANAKGDPFGSNLMNSNRMFKSGRMTFKCPIS